MMTRRIPTLEITQDAQDRIQRLCERLRITDPRDLINRALKALEVMDEVAGTTSDSVDISSADGKTKITTKIRP